MFVFPLFEGLLALGFWPLLCIAGFCIAMVVGCTTDRNSYKSEPKWYVASLAVAVLFSWGWWSLGWTLATAWAAVTSWALWRPLCWYAALGIAYSFVEFAFEVRRCERYYAEKWQAWVTTPKFWPESALEVIADNLDPQSRPASTMIEDLMLWRATMRTKLLEIIGFAPNNTGPVAITPFRIFELTKQYPAVFGILKEKALKEFVNDHSIGKSAIRIEVGIDTPKPYVDKFILIAHLGAWVTLWPFYLVSLVVGDLLTEVFRQLANFLVSISGRFVRFTFSNTFKF